ncbi:MAG: hypothetical protein ABW223_04625 [Rariglobus sp.]
MNTFFWTRSMVGLLALVVSLGLVSACSKNEKPKGANNGAHHHHEHVAPHGGTLVVLGDEAFHLELVRDAEAGRLEAYVMDGELEKFIRLPLASFEMTASVNGVTQTLMFKPVANAATGETAGDTSLFSVEAEWLKTHASFDAVITAITVRGTTFTAVQFNFPKGNDAGGHSHSHGHSHAH